MANPFAVSGTGGVPEAYNFEQVRQALAMRCGQGLGCEVLAPAEIDEFLEAARRELNTMVPLWYWGSFQTVAGQQRYAAGSIFPNNYLGNAKIFWQGGATAGCANMVLFPSFGSQWDVMLAASSSLVGSSVEYERIQMVMRTYARMQRVYQARGWLERDGYVWLDPVPGGAQTVYFACTVPRFSTVVSITDDYAEAFFDFAGARACEMLAAKQSEVVRGDDGGGKSFATAGGSVFLKLAEKLEARFYERVGDPLTVGLVNNLSGA